MLNSLFLEDQLEDMETGEDLAIIFKEDHLLKGNQDRQTFKESLQIIGRNDLAEKLDIYVAASK